MKLRFKRQQYQIDAVNAVVDCLEGQPPGGTVKYRIDPGRDPGLLGQMSDDLGFRNPEIQLSPAQLLENIRKVQRRNDLPESLKLVPSKAAPINLDIEMETGTGKTYCYIRTMFELHRRYGFSKFIVVVPSIAIREGVYKSFQITEDHFLEEYGHRARYFIYNSRELHNLERFSSDAGLNVMIINMQAFNATGKDARRIYEELDDFQSRKPIDVIAANRPILILDEPQKMEGKRTLEALARFRAPMVLRYSATHRTEHNKVYRLDAIDAYNQKLVKKIAVHGITVRGLTGTNGYLYLEAIEVSKDKPPEARVEMEIRTKSGIKREVRKLKFRDDLHVKSGGLDQYKGFVVSDIDAYNNVVSFLNGVEISVGEAIGDVNELTLRRIQIREAIRAHLRKERELFAMGIKVLTLFFIDEVAKYRDYSREDEKGDYARIFEEEYQALTAEVMSELPLDGLDWRAYLQRFRPDQVHNGYFSIDKRTKRLTDPVVRRRGEEAGLSDDVDAYDLILKDKERLLSFDEPVRFIFSHSALREGWDNPNVFVICALKYSDSTISRRQEVGRGLRLAVNQNGERVDDPAIVHDVNVLTVVASESYRDFVNGLQKDISETLSSRPRKADEAYFTGKVLRTGDVGVVVTPPMARLITRYLIRNDYVDDHDRITPVYHEAAREGRLAPLPTELASLASEVHRLIASVYSDALLPDIVDASRTRVTNLLNNNFHKREFQELWSQINRKAIYTVDFDSQELIEKCIRELDRNLRVSPIQYQIVKGEQVEQATAEAFKSGTAFEVRESGTEVHKASVHSAVAYDLVGNLSEATMLTRSTIAAILKSISPPVFAQFKTNPEDFIRVAAQLINEQKATVIVEHLAYNPTGDTYDINIFTQEKLGVDYAQAFDAKKHIFDFVFTDGPNERRFVEELDVATEIVVYAKLPKGFSIPTPLGNYNPDWAIAFEADEVKHVYFVAETKGNLSTLQLRPIESGKVECARKFFAKITSDRVKYDVVDSYAKLMEIVQGG